MIYADTSFIVKLYWSEPESQKAIHFVQQLSTPLLWTDFHHLEFSNTLSLMVFRKEILHEEAAKISNQIQDDISAEMLSRSAVDWTIIVKESQNISLKHSYQIGTRTLDILHVACALYLKANRFLTFDERQKKLAHKVGLKT